MLIDIFKKVANESTLTTDDQQSAMVKAAEDKDITKASNLNSDVVPQDNIGDNDLRS